MSNVTPEDLISYLYGETDATRTAEIESALTSNWALREKLSVLQTSMQRLDKAKLSSPSEGALNSIMAYARDGVEKRAQSVPEQSSGDQAKITRGG
jgi:anti-sigma factor RsiW